MSVTQAPASALLSPFSVQIPQRSQPVQLHQHGNGPELGRVLGRLPVQDPQTHVRQLLEGDERVGHACGAVRALPGVLRHRGCDTDADLGPGDEAHLRECVNRNVVQPRLRFKQGPGGSR